MKKHTVTIVVSLLFVAIAIGAVVYYRSVVGSGAKKSGLKGKLVVFHAGSLSVPFRQLAAAFRKKHPGVTVQAEAAGSRHCARKISDLGRRADVMGSADFRVVENLVMPEHATWNIRFATNEMAIA